MARAPATRVVLQDNDGAAPVTGGGGGGGAEQDRESGGRFFSKDINLPVPVTLAKPPPPTSPPATHPLRHIPPCHAGLAALAGGKGGRGGGGQGGLGVSLTALLRQASGAVCELRLTLHAIEL